MALLSRITPVTAAGLRSISTTSRLNLREAFRELRDLGFAPRFRDHHARMIAKRPDPELYYQLDEYIPIAALVMMIAFSLNEFRRERQRDLARMLEYQFRDEDQQRMAEYERYYERQLDGI